MKLQNISNHVQTGHRSHTLCKGGMRAVIVGGGISGLLSASVLAPYCSHIQIIDQDDLIQPQVISWPLTVDSMKWRRGVPQICQPHQLTAGGVQALEYLLPGFRDEVLSLGGVDLDLARHVHYFDHGSSYPSFDSNLRGLGVSRPFLEQCLRERVYRDLGTKLNVIQDVMMDMELQEGEIGGVVLKRLGLVPCDVYVDAAGKKSILPELLHKHGYGRPGKIFVDAKIKSVSRLVKIPETFSKGWKLLVIKSLPTGTKGGSLLPMEGGIWQAILADAGGSDTPRTDGEFLSFAKSLPDDTMYHILKSSTPVTNISVYQAMRNEKILYNQMDIPNGILPLGDSAQRLNPIYGQGITVAAQSAMVLSQCLAKTVKENHEIELDFLSKMFIKDLYDLLQDSWNMAVASDFRFPTTVTNSNTADLRPNKFEKILSDGLLLQAQRDPKLYLKLLEIAHLTKPVSSLSRDLYVLKIFFVHLISGMWERHH